VEARAFSSAAPDQVQKAARKIGRLAICLNSESEDALDALHLREMFVEREDNGSLQIAG
jgi:hypothetical protein